MCSGLMNNSKRLVLMDLKYEVLETVGQGAFAKVVLVRDKKDHTQHYIAKVINTAALPEKQREFALNEAKLLAQLSHPHIIKYEECYSDSVTFHILMEYARHGDLWNRISQQRAKTKVGQPLEYFAVPQLLRWFVQMASALFYLHSHRVLHRDLKSKNILMADDDNLKIGDFGFSRVLEQNDSTDTVCGTPHYMAPEILANKNYDTKCDVWALGCILYDCAMLQHAFKGHGVGGAKQINSLMQKVTKAQYPPLEGYPEKFEYLMGQLLCVDPAKRPSCRRLLLLPYVNEHLMIYVQSIQNEEVKEYFNEEMLRLQEDSDEEGASSEV